MNISTAIELAEKHNRDNVVVMSSSAAVAIQDAKSLAERGLIKFAAARAMKSLSYTVGVFHPVYKKVAEWERSL